ncbi:MAG: hypothetical protein SR2Q5_07115, partial [Quinella sp. 2Q5]|nr:hypothetical protein [Quinella sp. 2Q5]
MSDLFNQFVFDLQRFTEVPFSSIKPYEATPATGGYYWAGDAEVTGAPSTAVLDAKAESTTAGNVTYYTVSEVKKIDLKKGTASALKVESEYDGTVEVTNTGSTAITITTEKGNDLKVTNLGTGAITIGASAPLKFTGAGSKTFLTVEEGDLTAVTIGDTGAVMTVAKGDVKGFDASINGKELKGITGTGFTYTYN